MWVKIKYIFHFCVYCVTYLTLNMAFNIHIKNNNRTKNCILNLTGFARLYIVKVNILSKLAPGGRDGILPS